MAPTVLGVFPKFLVRDVATTLEYYRDVFGFNVASSVGAPAVFGIVERDGHGIHFKQGEPRTRRAVVDAWDAYFEVRDIDALYAELVHKGAHVTRRPQTQPYGMKEFDVSDPDGYILCFSEDIG